MDFRDRPALPRWPPVAVSRARYLYFRHLDDGLGGRSLQGADIRNGLPSQLRVTDTDLSAIAGTLGDGLLDVADI